MSNLLISKWRSARVNSFEYIKLDIDRCLLID